MGRRRADGGRAAKYKLVLPLVMLLLLGFGLNGLWTAARLSAAGESSVGFVDVGRLIDDYLAPVVDGPLVAETERLQAEFDEAARHLDEAATQELFVRYQTMLNLVKHELIDGQLPLIHAAIGTVAERESISVVLDKQSVLYGGVDLTDTVLQYLWSRHGQGGEG